MRRRDVHGRGESNGHAKLTNAQALEIYRSKDRCSALAPRYGVTPGAIRNIKTGVTWVWLTKAKRRPVKSPPGEEYPWAKLTREEVPEIFRSHSPARELAEQYEVSIGAIRGVWNRLSWSWLTKGLKR